MSTITSGSIVTPETQGEWLAERLNSVGASEAAAAVGVCPYTTPVELWQRKTARAPAVEENEAMRWGKALEPLIQAEYERRTGRVVELSQVFYRHPIYPYMSCTLDGLCGDRILEIKTASAWSRDWGDEDGDQIPDPYLIQVHQQMAVTGARLADVAVLIGGQKFRVYTVERNDDLCNRIEDMVSRFWECVVRDNPPDWGRMTPGTLLTLNPGCDGEIALDNQTAMAVEVYESISKRIKDDEERREVFKVEILKAMGGARTGLLGDGRLVRRYVQDVAERTTTTKAHAKHFFKLLKGNNS